MRWMLGVMVALSLCARVAVAEFDLTPDGPIPEQSTTQLTLGPFTSEDGVTPVVPETVTISIYRRGKPANVANELLAPLVLVQDTDYSTATFSVTLASATMAVLRPKPTVNETHEMTLIWTWAGGVKQGTKRGKLQVEPLTFLP